MKKTAEFALTDADMFPRNSCYERLARRYGEDSVCLSGPCEGKRLCDCVCDQLESRWDRIKGRFADTRRIGRLATKLAESYMQKDDTKVCVADLQKSGYKKEAAEHIASFLRSYAMDPAADLELDDAMNSVEGEESVLSDDVAPESPFGGAGDGLPSETEPAMEEPLGEGAPPTDLGAEPEIGTEPGLGGELPPSVPEAGMEPELENPSFEGGKDTVTIEIPVDVVKELAETILKSAPEGLADAGGIAEEPLGDLGMDAPMDVEVVDLGSEGGEPEVGLPEAEHEIEEVATGEDTPEEAVEELKEGGEKEEEVPGEPKEEQPEDGQFVSTATEKPEKKEEKKEAGMKAGIVKKAGDTVLKIGPEMSINNTDQLGGHTDKQLGTAKEKAVEAPKSLPEGNVHPEGYTAGGNKFQDGKTMGAEEKFDAKTINKSDVSGGQSSIMGKDESYPKGGPSVPAGSAAINDEPQTGGDVSTKGTVIAELTPKGILVQANGKKFLGPIALSNLSTETINKIADGIGKIAFNGDAKAFTRAAVKVAADSCKDCTKTDTSKLEATKFTNDAEKKPAEDKAPKAAPKKDAENPTTDTSKLEGSKFTNDAEKKPEGEKKASTEKIEKTADQNKAVEAPKPVEDNMHPEGFVAGGDKVQDGKTMGAEEKFDAKKGPTATNKSDVTGGQSSILGKDESYPEGGPKVPAGGPAIGNETLTGGDVSTKGTTIAESQSQNSVTAEANAQVNAAKVQIERYKAAGVYCAELLRNGEITEAEFSKEMEKTASMSVPAIQSLILSTKKARERVAANAAKNGERVATAGLGIPVVVSASNNEQQTLTQRLVSHMKLTQKLDEIDGMKPTK